MKSLLTIFLSLFLAKGCVKEQDFKDVKIVYEANSRGFHKTITIENKTFTVVSKRDAAPVVVTLTDAEWTKLALLYSKIDLNTYNNLKGPTEERFFDGKAGANLLITVKEKQYATQGFDHTIPPAEIKEIVGYILSFSEVKTLKNTILGNYKITKLGKKDVTNSAYFLNFEQETVSGFMGCNAFSGNYKSVNTELTFGALMATKKYCFETMDDENNWFTLSKEITHYKVEQNELKLFNNKNEICIIATKN
jgi:heat shock protein HslJ